MRRNCTPHWNFCTMQRTLVKFMWVVRSLVAKIYWHNQDTWSWALSALVMCSLCRYCFSPLQEIIAKLQLVHLDPFTAFLSNLNFIWIDNANPCAVFGERCILYKRRARAYCRVDLRGFRKMASISRFTLLGAGAENGRPCSVLSFTAHSWRHFDIHNSRGLRQGTSRHWKCCRKPGCVAVTDCVLINNSTAAVRCCTDQRSISTKLQTLLCRMTVSTKAGLSWHAGFKISKTIRCFWRTRFVQILNTPTSTRDRRRRKTFPLLSQSKTLFHQAVSIADEI